MRTFVAIDLDEPVREILSRVQERLRASPCNVKWVETENLHVTLRFLGELQEGVVPSLLASMRSAAMGQSGFAIELRGLGWFPPRRPPRTIWAGIEEPTGSLARLHERLEAEVRKLGIGPDGSERTDRFHPHVTLGRVREPGGTSALERAITEASGTMETGRQEVRSFVVKRSVLGSKGPEYTTLGEASLA